MRLFKAKTYEALVGAGEKLKAAQLAEMGVLTVANQKLKSTLSASKVTGDLLRGSMMSGNLDLAASYATQVEKTDAKSRRQSQKTDKQVAAAAAETAKLEQVYAAATERYSKQSVLRSLSFTIAITLVFYGLYLLGAKASTPISADYFGVTAQIFPVLFIALYIESPGDIRATDGVWSKLNTVFDGLSLCVYGTAVSLFVVATGHLRFIGVYITLYCFGGMLPEVFAAITRRRTKL